MSGVRVSEFAQTDEQNWRPVQSKEIVNLSFFSYAGEVLAKTYIKPRD